MLKWGHGGQPQGRQSSSRVCEEHKLLPQNLEQFADSSPHVRGTHLRLKPLLDSIRFIPACAGNTFSIRPAVEYSPVHPRVCGEHRAGCCDYECHAGSSPRVRGTPRPPARPSTPRPVHPRVCGEHFGQLLPNVPLAGSSPRVRGTPRRNTTLRTFATVHPRVCGEHWRAAKAGEFKPGSSPRVRGTRCRDSPERGHCRFIPACAGNTAARVL